ncbi:hypothetical protein [Cellulomonas sp. HZM]|uniref:hypothetical protein n=1 Tax=Cellulomonas sp. HZM TaxID=1454010 RepID=UPI00049329CB|nr:hypothetical protein [Cellulomonas sp. HZM]
MGRHASREPDARAERRWVPWAERAGMGVAAALVVLLVLRWADVGWGATLAIAGAALVLVPAAAWVASTVPGHDGQHGDVERS